MKLLRNFGFYILVGAVLIVTLIAVRSAGGLGSGAENEQVEILRQAVMRSAASCYALEGAYPPDVAYLEAHYGLSIDHDRYTVHYKVEGSNLPPDIDVFRKK